MEDKHTRRGFTQTVVNKNCHSRGMLSGIYTLAKEQGEDPRQKPSGMTLNKITVRGFTLIELLVVVLIIGILAAVAVPQYQKAVYKSQYVRIKPIVKSIADAQEVYYLTNGSYADSLDELDIEMPEGYDTTKSNSTSRYYNWSKNAFGTCSSNSTGQTLCFYEIPGAWIQFQIVGKNADLSLGNGIKSTGKIMCQAKGDIFKKICQSETGKTTADWDNTANGWAVYIYN